MAILIILNRRILKGMKVLNNTTRRAPQQSQEPSFVSNAAQERSQRRHMNEIRTTHMAIAIVISFAVLNLPRIAISAKEVTNTNLIINCIENKRKFFPSLQYYQIDIIARTFMMVNSAINFVIYSAVSHPFQVSFLIVSTFSTKENITSKQLTFNFLKNLLYLGNVLPDILPNEFPKDWLLYLENLLSRLRRKHCRIKC